MNQAYKAKETSIVLGSVLVKVFQLPNGEYRLSQSQVTEAIGKRNRSIIEFLGGKSLEALPYKGSELSESLSVEGANKPITETLSKAHVFQAWDVAESAFKRRESLINSNCARRVKSRHNSEP
jgi:hypothetical protein